MKYKRSTLNFQLSTLLVAVLFAAPMRAQVVIGNNSATPRPFSLLEMETTYRKGGLRLPQLTSAQCDSLATVFTSGGFSPTEAQDAKGLVVYNTGDGCVEYWNAGQWNSLCDDRLIYFVQDGNDRVLKDINNPFPPFAAGGGSLTLTPHDSPECSASTPYTADIRMGSEYAQVTPITPATGKFSLTLSINTTNQSRIAILRITNKCTGSFQDFLVLQDAEVCSNPTITSTTGLTQTISSGSNIVMTVTATSSIKPLNYQWYWGKNDNIAESLPVGGAQSDVLSTTLSSEGVYYFWCKVSNVCGEVTSSMFTIALNCRPAQPNPIVGDKIVYKNGIATFWVVKVPGVSYNWSIPSDWTQIAGGNSNSITVKVGAESGTISVTPDNGCDAGSGLSRTMEVSVAACGAYTGGVWREFMCWNLGADFSADPFEPAKALNGDYYRWGQPVPAGSVDGVIGVWNSTYNDSYVWGNGADGDLTTTLKSATDPCPDGYRVPNQNEWSGLVDNAKLNKPAGVDWVGNDNIWLGSMYGGSLFLPSAGTCGNLGVATRGIIAEYWSSAFSIVSATNRYGYLFFTDASSSTSTGFTVAGVDYALPVRCIAVGEDDDCLAPNNPGAITGAVHASKKAVNGITYSIATVPGATSYTWTAPAGWTLGGGSTNTFTTASRSIAAFPGASAADGNITVTANSGSCTSLQSTLAVNVIDNCGAFIDGYWREFMCWNLRDDGVYGYDPFTPSAEINGDYYQWGGSTAAALGSDPPGSSGVWGELDSWYGDLGTADGTEKSEYDPCPTGFRVPKPEELRKVITSEGGDNERKDTGAWTNTNNCSDCWAGSMFGDALFLPAAGERGSGLYDRGYQGYYWTNATRYFSNSHSQYGYFNGDEEGLSDSSASEGMTIRCIAED